MIKRLKGRYLNLAETPLQNHKIYIILSKKKGVMAQQTDPHKKFREVGQRLEDIIGQAEAIDHVINHAYYATVEKHGLHRNEYGFNEEQKKELITSIITGLKEHLFYVKGEEKAKALRALDEATWEEAILPSYFGISRFALEEMLQDEKTITREHIAGIVRPAMERFRRALSGPELQRIKPDELEKGRGYIKALSEETKHPYDLRRIRTPEHLYSAMDALHSARRRYRLMKERADA